MTSYLLKNQIKHFDAGLKLTQIKEFCWSTNGILNFYKKNNKHFFSDALVSRHRTVKVQRSVSRTVKDAVFFLCNTY